MARTLTVTIIGDASSLRRELRRSSGDAKNFDRTLSQTFRGTLAGSGAFAALGRSLAFASGAFLGAATAAKILSDSIGAASNLAEQTSKTKTVFGAAADEVIRFSEDALGLARDTALETASSIGALLKPIGLVGAESARTSIDLTKLGVDLSSFYNTDVSEALDAIRSGLVGESEPLRRYGVLLSEARVNAEALHQTGKRSVTSLTAQEKVLARISLIFKDAKAAGAVGDYAKTIGGLANQQRELAKNVRNTEILLGQALLPTLTRITGSLNEWLGASENQEKIQRVLNDVLTVTGKVLRGVALAFKVARFLMQPVIDAMRTMVDLGRDLVKVFNRIKDSAFFDKLKDIAPRLLPADVRRLGEGVQGLLDREGSGGVPGSSKPGQSTADRQPGRSPRGAGAFRAVNELAALVKHHASLAFQLSLLNEELAKAELTATKRDDRAVLSRQANVLRELIARTRDLKKRTSLYQQLGQVESQIKSIDEQQAQAAEEAAAKQKEARQRQLAALREREATLRAQIKDIRDKFKAAIDTAREGIGSLFSGPVVNPSDDIRRRILGVGRPISQDPAKLVADVNAQVREFTRRQREIAALQKLAPKGLRGQLGKELAGVGIEQLDALAGASPGQKQAFIKAFAARERAAAKVARVSMTAQFVTLHAKELKLAGLKERERPIIIELDGKVIARSTTTHQQRRDKDNAASRRGRNAGRG